MLPLENDGLIYVNSSGRDNSTRESLIQLEPSLSPRLSPVPSCQQIRELVPESQAYMDLLAFERKLDQTIMRKRVDIQEALKRPMKVCSAPYYSGP